MVDENALSPRRARPVRGTKSAWHEPQSTAFSIAFTMSSTRLQVAQVKNSKKARKGFQESIAAQMGEDLQVRTEGIMRAALSRKLGSEVVMRVGENLHDVPSF